MKVSIDHQKVAFVIILGSWEVELGSRQSSANRAKHNLIGQDSHKYMLGQNVCLVLRVIKRSC